MREGREWASGRVVGRAGKMEKYVRAEMRSGNKWGKERVKRAKGRGYGVNMRLYWWRVYGVYHIPFTTEFPGASFTLAWNLFCTQRGVGSPRWVGTVPTSEFSVAKSHKHGLINIPRKKEFTSGHLFTHEGLSREFNCWERITTRRMEGSVISKHDRAVTVHYSRQFSHYGEP